MAHSERIALLSDVHYAGLTERKRGNDYEYRNLASPVQRLVCHYYRRFFWLRDPLDHNDLLDRFLARIGEPDHVFALGDYSCDTGFVGVSDDGALESARECLDKLRSRFGTRLHAVIGDHELGKFSMFGKRGGLRFESWRRAREDLGLSPFWRVDIGPYACIGITSTLVMLPSFHGEILDDERPDWESARNQHLKEIRDGFNSLPDGQPIILFCHDPSALPFLSTEPSVQTRFDQIRQTFVGHLHSPLILWKSRRLAGMPRISFMGHTVNRLSTALGRAQKWKPFKVRLCPSLAGVELLKDGGFCTVEVPEDARERLTVVRHKIKR
jgi:hypothetical protein